MRRALTVAVLVAGALAPAAPASAHGGDTPTSTSFRTRVSGVMPAVPGLTVAAVEAGARLELTNDTGSSIEVLGYAGEPYLEVRPDGTYENVHSPAAYLNRTLAGDTALPPEADAAAPPQWRRVSGDTTVRWHDQRTHWMGDGLPPVAAADPGSAHHLRGWVVPLRQETRDFEVRGTLDYLPSPPVWPWWLGVVLVGLAAFRLSWWAGAAAGCGLILYGVLTTIDASAPVVVFAAGLFGISSFFSRTSPFLLTLTGIVVAVFGGLVDSGVFGAAVIPVAGPYWIARAATMLAIGAGLGMAAGGVVQLRKVSDAGDRVVA